MARAPAMPKRPADVAPPAPAWIVATPLRHDQRNYAPGEPAPAGLTQEQVERLLRLGVLRPAPS